MSGRWIEGVLSALIGGCLEGVSKVSGRCVVGVCNVSGRCLEGPDWTGSAQFGPGKCWVMSECCLYCV